MLSIIRPREARTRLGISNSTLYLAILDGTIPPPVRIAKRCTGWPESELDAVLAARIRGESDDAVRELIARLVAQRKQVRPPEMPLGVSSTKAARARERGLAKARLRPKPAPQGATAP